MRRDTEDEEEESSEINCDKGNDRARYRMASSSVEDEDLIDLESAGSSCLSRAVMPEASAEELEHLLDVCPPQLEQKLSLTRKQELVREHTDNGDVLVTLGHDQVVPRRKRIDVVSSETIKRVRDITKNLEPVIQTSASSRLEIDDDDRISEDKVDGSTTKIHSQEPQERSEVTEETRAINTAFDFLMDLDDVDDDDPPPDKRRRTDATFENSDREITPSENFYPLEPTCLIEKESTTYRDIDRANRDMEANDRTSVMDIVDSDEKTDGENVNGGFETSPLSKFPHPKESDFVQHPSFPPTFVIERQPRFARLWDDCGTMNRGISGITSGNRSERKSWSEGGARGSADGTNNVVGFERSTSIDVERICEPSTSGIATFLRRSARNIGRRPAEQSTSSSECSEVDWSWVEEYESPSVEAPPSSSSSSTTVNHRASCRSKSNNNVSSAETAAPCPNVRPASAPTRSVPGTPTIVVGETNAFANNADGERERMRAGGQPARDSNGSVAMSVGGTGKSSPSGTTPGSLSVSRDVAVGHGSVGIDRETTTSQNNFNDATVCNGNTFNRGSTGVRVDETFARNNDNRGNEPTAPRANSWVRASMRRIRHLRLPDADRRNVDVNATTRSSAPILSAPNSLPDIALIAPEVIAAQTNVRTGTTSGARPSSAPSTSGDNSGRSSGNASTPRRGGRHGGRSRDGTSQERIAGRGRNGSRGNSAVGDNAEIGVQTGNSATTSPAGRRTVNGPPQHPSSPASATPRRTCERQRDADRDNERGEDDDEDDSPLGRWPHPLSPALACLGCTLGLFNISRFAILSIRFGANFIVQFLVLTLVLGIPLLTLQVCLGQRLAAGAVDMWRISPVFHGVGVALLVAQACIGIYSIIGVSWMFVYFRDSFIAKQDRYRWAEPFLHYRDDIKHLHNTSTYKLQETVPDYFSGVVLQRHHLNEPESGVTIKFQVAFNLAVVWMIVFVSLSKGLRSYGKVVYVFTLVPVFGTLLLCTKLLGLIPPGSMHQLFTATVWSEFFINGKSWVAASSEVFLTWGILGAAAMQMAAHNKHKHLLQRDTSLVVILTLVVLLLAAFLANTCVQILRHYGYQYTSSSFEKISGYTFMRHVNQGPPSGYGNTPERFMPHASFLLGQRVVKPGADLSAESGYQVLRLSTELVPATLAILGTEKVSPFWAVLFYFILILFGIAQQLAIWHCVITGIMAINTKMMKLWETSITFFSCACAYILGLPMATELGIYVVYYLDYTIGGAWWIMILYLVQVGAVFVVRGRPHTGETVVAELFPPTGRCLRHWAGPLLSFTWNVVLPGALMTLSIIAFKTGYFRELYVYRKTSRDYWSVWARQLGAAIQLTPILIIPGVAIIQTCRYLNSGPSDIFDAEEVEISCAQCEQCNANRIQLLYRPPLDADDPGGSQMHYGNDGSTSIHGNGILPSSTDVPFEDPPPKYTPPPSYTTATGARIAKMLRQSFRRSVRRIASVLGETSAPRTRPALQPPPPDYATVLVEMNQTMLSRTIDVDAPEPRPDVTDTARPRAYSADRHRPNTIDRTTRISTIDRIFVERTHSTMDRTRRIHGNTGTSNLTAADVANLLRSSIRRGPPRNQPGLRESSANDETTTNAASVENLVSAAAPIGEDSLVFPKNVPLVHEDDNDDDDEKKTVNEMDNSVSVI